MIHFFRDDFIPDNPGGKGGSARHGELGLFLSHHLLLRNAGDSSDLSTNLKKGDRL